MSRPDIDTVEVARRYLAGESSERIAADLSCCVRTVFLRLAKAGVSPRPVGKVKPFGEDHPKWTGGRSIAPSGYAVISVLGRRVLEHRYVVERLLGRPLRWGEDVHHVDGDRANNHPDNLVLLSTLEHQRLHWTQAPRARGERGRWVKVYAPIPAAAADMAQQLYDALVARYGQPEVSA